MDRLEDRMLALENKLDVVADSIRADLKTVLEAVTAGTEEMRRITDAIRKEHQADRRLMMSHPRRSQPSPSRARRAWPCRHQLKAFL